MVLSLKPVTFKYKGSLNPLFPNFFSSPKGIFSFLFPFFSSPFSLFPSFFFFLCAAVDCYKLRAVDRSAMLTSKEKCAASEKGKRVSNPPGPSIDPSVAPTPTCVRSLELGGGRRRLIDDKGDPGASDETGDASTGDGLTDRSERDPCPARSGPDEPCLGDPEIARSSLRQNGPTIKRLTPFNCHRDGTIEELPDLALSFDRSCRTDGQDWGDIGPTHSTSEGVSLLMEKSRASGVTFMIPISDQRPWSPPVG